MGILALFSSALSLAALPPLPQQGLALETKAGVQLQTLAGRGLATIPGLDLAVDKKIGRQLVMRDRRGRLFTLDPAARRVRRTHEYPSRMRGCRLGDAMLYVCRQAIVRGGHVLARKPRGIGHWVWAERAPKADAVLAQWSAECEVPVAYLILRGGLISYGSGTVALGWLANGSAAVYFPRGGGCGPTPRAPGIYAVPLSGDPRLLLRTRKPVGYAMWGG
jgi:hypothetical protein